MHSTLLILLVLGVPAAALAQSPDEEWLPLPGTSRPEPPPPSPEPSRPRLMPPSGSPPPLAPAPPPSRTIPRLRARLPIDEPNEVSMFGAPALGQWKRGQAFVLGFPFIQLRASIGLLDSLDVGLGYDTFYFMHHEVRGSLKYGFGKGPGWSVALAFEGGGAFFNVRANREVRGTRWLTGRRNFNLVPGAIVSYEGASRRAARLFLDLRYMLTVDTEPFATTPLQGVPSAVVLGHNALARAGGEFPLTERTSFLFTFGLDLHFRPDDAPAMVNVAVGLVTGL